MFVLTAQDRGPTEDFWYEPVPTNVAGSKVTPDTAMKLSAFWSCAIVKAQAVAQLPLCVYRNQNGRKDKARDLDLFRLVHTRPNRYQTSYQWREMGQLHLDLRGNFYNRIITDRAGRIVELIPIHPDLVKVERLTETSHRYLIHSQDRREVLTMDEVFHVAGPTLDGPVGLTPVEFHRETIGKAIATRDYGSAFYRNGATMPGWLEYPSKLDEEQRRRLQSSFQKSQTGTNRFKTPVLDRGMQYHELSIKHTDLQYLESLKDEDTVICQIMRVPPYKVYRMEQAKFSNVEQMQMDFVRDTLVPVLTRWEQAMDSQLLDEQEAESLFFKFVVAGLLRGDTQTRGEFYKTALGSGGHSPFMTVNEIRELEDRNPIEGGDELPAVENSQQPLARFEAMLKTNAERCVAVMAGKAEKAIESGKDLGAWSAEFFSKHTEWVADVMQIDQRTADRYCTECELSLLSSDNPSSVIEAWRATGVDRLLEVAR